MQNLTKNNSFEQPFTFGAFQVPQQEITGRVSTKMQERYSYAKEISDEILTGQSRHTVTPSMGTSLLFKGL